MKKTSSLYVVTIALWLGLLGATFLPLWQQITGAEQYGTFIATLVIISTLFIAYFWLNGMKDLVYTMYYYIRRKHLGSLPPLGHFRLLNGNKPHMKVAMVYCTYNDFNAESLEACMHQDYPNHKVVILDDSNDEKFMRIVDNFARAHDIEVVRRPDHIGFKAGNLNNYLQTADYDYFVILDSDEIVPPNFITRSLDYFSFYPNAGIVQATHTATRNRNKFMRLFAIGVDSHWPTYQTVKHFHGFLSLLGHGAMVSRECYQSAGGFPHLVAEDLCFSIEARNKGFYTAFAPDIKCEEEYPISYLAFKKRHSKWTQGNMEFIKKYTWRILSSKMNWYEKLDIILFTYSLPLSAFFGLYVVINVVLLPMMNYRIVYPIWLLIPTVLFLIAPMLNDIIFHARKVERKHLVWYLAHSMLLYGSMLFTSLQSSIKSTFGKSVFLVTPKEHDHLSFRGAIRANRGEILFGVALLVIATIFNKSPLPTVMIAIPSMFSIYLALMANSSEHKAEAETVATQS